MKRLSTTIVKELESLQKDLIRITERAYTLSMECSNFTDKQNDYEFSMVTEACKNLLEARSTYVDLAALNGSEECNRIMEHRMRAQQ